MWCPRHQDEGAVWEASRFHGFYSLIRRDCLQDCGCGSLSRGGHAREAEVKAASAAAMRLVVIQPGLGAACTQAQPGDGADPCWALPHGRPEGQSAFLGGAGCRSHHPTDCDVYSLITDYFIFSKGLRCPTRMARGQCGPFACRASP